MKQMKALNRSNISFFIAVIVLTVEIFCTRHYTQLFSSNPFIDVVFLISGLLIMSTFFFSDDNDKQLRTFLWGLVSVGIVIMSVALITTSGIS